MQPSSTTFNRTYPRAQLTPPSAVPSCNWMHNKILIPNSYQVANFSTPVNPFSTTTNIAPPFVTPVIHPTYGYAVPISLRWGGPPRPTPPAPASKNESLIKAFTDALNSKRNDPLPEWKLSQYNGDPLQRHEWYGQFKSAIDSQSLTDDVKLTYLKNLVTGKAKMAIAEFAYCGATYKDALRTLERKFCQPQVVVSAHLYKLNSFPPLKMHNSDNIINYSGCISSLVGVFKSLSYYSDLKSAAFFNTAVQKLPPNMKELWSLFTVKKHWVKTTLLDFKDWLMEKAEAHDLMKNTALKARTEGTSNSVTRSKVASKSFAANTQHKSNVKPQQSSPSPPISSCIVCKGSHRLWECRVFKEKTPMQRAKVVAEAKLCFSCLRDKHKLRQCKCPSKCRKDGCNSSHNTLLHGAERVFPAKPSTNNNINTLRSRTQILVGHLPVNSNQAKQPLCLQWHISNAYFRSQNWNLLTLLVLVLRRWFYAIPIAVTLGCPIVSQIVTLGCPARFAGYRIKTDRQGYKHGRTRRHKGGSIDCDTSYRSRLRSSHCASLREGNLKRRFRHQWR